jgi:hypothetical protein
MILFAIFYQLAEVVMFMIVLFQFFLKLVTGETNSKLRQLGQNLGAYILQVVQFLTFNSEQHPYPFSDWPDADIVATVNTTSKPDTDNVVKRVEQDVDKD